MKRCPKCNANYFDNMLEFCLEDGSRLTFAMPDATATLHERQQAAVTVPLAGPIAAQNSEETVFIKKPVENRPFETIRTGSDQTQTAKILEAAPIVLALAHNWWQWLYLEKTSIYSITEFLLSANFLMWLLLLASGTAAGLFAVKSSKTKTIGIITLVTLAINLILFLVPRR
jgi:hypothetical protein